MEARSDEPGLDLGTVSDEVGLEECSDEVGLEECSDEVGLEECLVGFCLIARPDDPGLDECSDDPDLDKFSDEVGLEECSDEFGLEARSDELGLMDEHGEDLCDDDVGLFGAGGSVQYTGTSSCGPLALITMVSSETDDEKFTYEEYHYCGQSLTFFRITDCD